MSKPFNAGRLDVSSTSKMGEIRSRPEPEIPFKIAVLGDFSGRENRVVWKFEGSGLSPSLHQVDRDNFDQVMAALGVELRLHLTEMNGASLVLRFSELDDFHPDRIFESDVFDELREIRQKLHDPATFASAAEEVRRWTSSGQMHESVAAKEERLSAPAAPTSGSLLDQVIEGTKASPSQDLPARGLSGWSSFLREIVKPHLVDDVDEERTELLAAIDAASTLLMRSILHQPEYQAIEAAWRALSFLVSNLETDEMMELYLLDISRTELASELCWKGDPESTGIYRVLVKESVDLSESEPWGLIAGNFVFNRTREDIELLERMAHIASRAGAPFVSAAGPSFLGCKSLAATPDLEDWNFQIESEVGQAWMELRELPEAPFIGLALPRFLLRLPYGAGTDPIERFDFEEMADEPVHDHYLWGNPSFACACLLATAFAHQGWNLIPGSFQDLEGLPLHVYKEQGESRLKPCAETLLTTQAIEIIMRQGLMPLVSYKGSDKIRLVRFQSIADPPTPLIGQWE